MRECLILREFPNQDCEEIKAWQYAFNATVGSKLQNVLFLTVPCCVK